MKIEKLTADDLIFAYMHGIFPMADVDNVLYWYTPDPRAIIPIESYKPARSLCSVINKQLFEIRVNHNFEGVMRGCATARKDGEATWISEEIIGAYCELQQMGLAYSVEAYCGNQLAGGLYGVAIGGAFFGESMFYTMPNASKVSFHYLIKILQKNNYQLLDTQFINDNVLRYGAVEIPRNDYLKILKKALKKQCSFEFEGVFCHKTGL